METGEDDAEQDEGGVEEEQEEDAEVVEEMEKEEQEEGEVIVDSGGYYSSGGQDEDAGTSDLSCQAMEVCMCRSHVTRATGRAAQVESPSFACVLSKRIVGMSSDHFLARRYVVRPTCWRR